MNILLFILGLLIIFGIPIGLTVWFVISLARYIRSPKELRHYEVGMLVASSVTLSVVLTLVGWLIYISMQEISFM